GFGMIGTAALLGLGAAVVQAVFPGIVKRQFPRHVSLVMGLYSSMLMGGGALGAQLAPLIATASGDWHFGLAWMALPALIAAVLALACLPRDAVRPQGMNAAADLLKRPRTWLLMACFGLVNGGYSTAVAWLAPYYQEQGWTSGSSGGLLAVMAVGQALSALLLPALAGKSTDRRPWLWLTLAMQGAGFAGLILQPGTAPFILALLLGAGLGGSFSLTMIVALEHLPDPAEAGALSAMMQGGGFLVAAIPPWIVAVLHDMTGGFRAGWLLHLACISIVTVLTFRLAPGSYGRSMRQPTVDALA
ncbi:MFS transporter, partial [Mesorhizobium sp. M2C.T.Ca.TU.009.01.2.1]